MDGLDRITKQQMLYSHAVYRGEFTPNLLLFNANLQEFSQKIGYISGLHTSGKLTSEQAYQRIQALWKDLKKFKKEILDEDFLA